MAPLIGSRIKLPEDLLLARAVAAEFLRDHSDCREMHFVRVVVVLVNVVHSLLADVTNRLYSTFSVSVCGLMTSCATSHECSRARKEKNACV